MEDREEKPALGLERLLGFARTLQNISSMGDLLEAALKEVQATTPYSHAWLMVKDDERDTHLRLIEVSGQQRSQMWELAPVLEVKGDPFLEALLASRTPVVI